MAKKRREQTYGIGAVSRLTGLSVHVLRVWERRHGAVTPQRSEGGRRYYTGRDIERLTLMKRLVDRGQTISRIATLSQEELEARLSDFERRASQRLTETAGVQRVAVLGEFLGLDLEALQHAELVLRATRPERFLTDARHLQPDLLLIEVPIVNQASRELVASLRRASAAKRVVAVYSIARHEDFELLHEESDALLRAPVTMGEIDRAILAAASPRPSTPAGQTRRPTAETGVTSRAPLQPVPKRRFTSSQLARLATVESAVDCECPRHLVELVDRLSLFEEYSAECEDRNNEDAALHGYLHSSTAQARSLIESALGRVVEAEQLDPGPP